MWKAIARSPPTKPFNEVNSRLSTLYPTPDRINHPMAKASILSQIGDPITLLD